MRVALISDLHGNEIALDAVLASIARTAVDQIVCLGDVATLGPCPAFVIDTLRTLGCPCIMGNHDEFLLEPDLIRQYTKIQPVIDSIEHCRAQLSAEDLAFVRTFERTLTVPLDEQTNLFLFHGSPESHTLDILADTPPEELDALIGNHEATVMAGGHTHIQMMRQHRGTLLVNPGSVGMPFREYVAGKEPKLMAHAEYAIVEANHGAVEVRLLRVPLDKGALYRAAEESDNPLRGMLMAQYS